MNIVIDIQGLKDKYNNFIPKEVAVISIESDFYAHWLVAAPHPYDELQPHIQRQNKWLKNNHHGIEWREGTTSLYDVENILKKIAARANRIFTRGHDKSLYLAHLTGCFIINLEEDDEVPAFRNLPASETFCIYHGLLHKNKKHQCSLNNITRIKKWLCHYDRYSSLWEYRITTTWNVGLSEQEDRDKRLRKKLSALACYEQSADSTSAAEYSKSRDRSIPSGSYPEGVDETDSSCG